MKIFRARLGIDGGVKTLRNDVGAAASQFTIELAEAMLARFHDAEHGGFWQSTANAADLTLCVKDDTDGAEPAGNSVATLALLKLATIADRADFHAAAKKTLRAAAQKFEHASQAMLHLLQALHF